MTVGQLTRPWRVIGSISLWFFLVAHVSGQTPDGEECAEPGIRTRPTSTADQPRPTYLFTIDAEEDIEIGDLQVEFVWTPLADSPAIGFTLTSPSGTTLEVLNRAAYWASEDEPPGVIRGQDLDVVFSDYGASFPGSVKDRRNLVTPRPEWADDTDPTPALSDFAGEFSGGEWVFEFNTDTCSCSVGLIERLCLRFFEERRALPVTEFACVRDSATVELNWVNAEDYEEVEIYLNDEFHGSVIGDLEGGGSVSYELEDLPSPQLAEVRVVPVIDELDGHAKSCQVAVPGEVTLDECSEPDLLWDSVDRPTSDTISIDEETTVIDMTVEFDMFVERIADELRRIVVWIESPSGTSVDLQRLCNLQSIEEEERYQHSGWFNAFPPEDYGFRTTYWALGRRNFPYFDAGEYMRASGPGSLQDFFGESTEGEWTLSFDKPATPTGAEGGEIQLVSWCLRFLEEGPGPLPVDDLACLPLPTSGEFEVSWTNAADYDEVRVFLDYELEVVLEGPFTSGTMSSVEVEIEPYPSYGHVAIQGVIGDGPGPKMQCRLRTEALGDLVCVSEGGSGIVDVSWTNFVDFEEVQVYVEDQLEATLAGTETSYSTDQRSLPTSVLVRVVAVLDSEAEAEVEQSCRTMLLGEARFEMCDSPAESVDSRVSFPMEVTDEFTVGVVEAHLELSGDAIFRATTELWSPDGTRVTLYRAGGADPHLTLGDGGFPYGSTLLDCECYVQPAGPGDLSDFRGQPSAGEWVLRVINEYPFVGGFFVVPVTVDEWCLRLAEECEGLAPSGLECAATDDGVELEWVNEDEYGRVEVYRDDKLLAALDGEVTSYEDTLAPAAHFEYRVVGYSIDSDCELLSFRCVVDRGLNELCLEDSLPETITADALELPLSMPFSGPVTGVEVSLELTNSDLGTNYTIALESASGTRMEQTWLSELGLMATFTDTGIPFDPLRVGSGLRMRLPSPTALEVFQGESVDADDTWQLEVSAAVASATTVTLESACVRVYEDDCGSEAPSALSCDNDAGTIALSWTAGSATRFEVRMDRVLIDTLSEGETSYELESPLHGSHVVEVQGFVDDNRCASWLPLRCVVELEPTWACEEPGVSIGGGDEVVEVVTIDDTDPVASVEVEVELPVSAAEDWRLTLESPMGTEVVLHSGRAFGPGLDVVFSDVGLRNDSSAREGLLDCDCRVEPEGPGNLSDFLGEDPDGDWSLHVSASEGVADSLLVSWCLGLAQDCSGLAPVDLQCVSASDGVELSWGAGEPYDEVHVLRDGVLIAALDGDAPEYLDERTVPAPYEYAVAGVIDDCRTTAARCLARFGALPACVSDPVAEQDDLMRTATLEFPDRFPMRGVELTLDVDNLAAEHCIELESPWGTRVTLSEGDASDGVLPDTRVPRWPSLSLPMVAATTRSSWRAGSACGLLAPSLWGTCSVSFPRAPRPGPCTTAGWLDCGAGV